MAKERPLREIVTEVTLPPSGSRGVRESEDFSILNQMLARLRDARPSVTAAGKHVPTVEKPETPKK